MVQATKRVLSGYKLIASYLGIILILIGSIILLPLLTLFAYPSEAVYAKCFFNPGILSIFIGIIMSVFLLDHSKEKLEKNHDAIIVTFAWILAILISTAPFVLAKQCNFLQALFECTSGYATVGLTVFDVSKLPHIFLMYRSIMLLFGGIGLVLIVTCVMSRYYGMRLYQAEGHADKVMPQLIKSARVIFIIYLGYIVIGTLMYVYFGMNWFDAINHAISAMSTGGFSTRPNSIEYYNSPQIEYVSIVLMLLGSINFLLHLYILKGDGKKFIKHCETKLMFWILLIFTPIVSVLILDRFGNDTFRTALFHIVSALTTTGLSTTSMLNFSTPVILIFVILMTVGGGVGSTAGGIKQYRIYILLKNWNIRNKIGSRYSIVPRNVEKFGEKVKVEDEERLSIANFSILYFLILILGTFIISCYGYTLQDSLLEFSSALSSAGLSSGIISSTTPAGILITCILGMFLGRLEMYIVFIALIKLIGDIKNKVIV